MCVNSLPYIFLLSSFYLPMLECVLKELNMGIFQNPLLVTDTHLIGLSCYFWYYNTKEKFGCHLMVLPTLHHYAKKKKNLPMHREII